MLLPTMSANTVAYNVHSMADIHGGHDGTACELAVAGISVYCDLIGC